MMMPDKLPLRLFAPCGINCGACYAHLRQKNVCPGCLYPDEGKHEYCRTCSIKACAQDRGVKRCYACKDFPCAMIKRINKRYLTSYGVGLIENGLAVRSIGLREFMASEKIKWSCRACGGIINLHRSVCSECNEPS
jgi:hypothetical protein